MHCPERELLFCVWTIRESDAREEAPLADVTIPERADDSRAGINYLRKRTDIDRERIGMLGLSEGGSIGPMIAASDPSTHAHW